MGALAVAAPALAGHSSLHVTASGDVAATDNTFATDRAQAEADMFTELRPGIVYSSDAPRFLQELVADVDLLDYAIHSSSPTITLHGGWQGLVLTGPRSQMNLAANASSAKVNALSSGTSPDQTSVFISPGGSVDVYQSDASENYSWVASRESRIEQGLYGRWTGTDDPTAKATTNSLEAGLTLGYERDFHHDSLELRTGASVLRLEYKAPVGAVPGSRLDHQLNPNASLVWRHDLGKRWSTNLDGGVVYVNPYGTDPYNPMDTTNKPGLFPVFGGLLAYTEVWGRATLSARRSVAPNLLIAQNTVDDSVIAQLALPLPWLNHGASLRSPALVGLASLGAERAQLLDPSSSKLEGEFYAGRLDAGVTWTPHPGQTYGLRYELVYQHASSVATMLVPIAPSYFRNTVYFTFSLRYPDDVTRRLPRHTDAVRADRKDLTPIGVEPVVPDPTGGGDQGDDTR